MQKTHVPFYPQRWELSKWKELGFKNLDDAQHWQDSSCGILCLKMAMDGYLSSQSKPLSPMISDIIKKGVKIGAYNDSVGWSHSGLVRLAKEYGFSAQNFAKTRESDLKQALTDGSLPIISTKWAFKKTKTLKERLLFWKKYGGHLVIVIGYKDDKAGNLEGFYVHHTSTTDGYNWKAKFIPLRQFKQGFTGRFIKINGPSLNLLASRLVG